MYKEFLFLSVLLFLSLSSALCTENQIDVNTASLEELDFIYGIGSAKAQSIIDARPYETLDELINAKGIGTVTLENIKSEGLACVSQISGANETSYQETEEQEETIKNTSEELNEESSEDKIKSSFEERRETMISPTSNTISDNKNSIQKIETINLSASKTIKTKEISKTQDNKDYAIYSLIVFSLFLGFLFFLDKKNKNKRTKNEFRNTEN